MARQPNPHPGDRAPTDPPADETEADVEGHNLEFYRQEARVRAREAEAIAREAERARQARAKETGRR